RRSARRADHRRGGGNVGADTARAVQERHRLRHSVTDSARAPARHSQGQGAVMDFGLLNYALFILVLVGIYGLMTLGLNMQWGLAGLFNAGIAGFFAIGAYTTAILTSPDVAGRVGGFGLPTAVGWCAAMLLSAALAWPIGRVGLRLRSDYLAIATIGVAEIIRLVARSEDWLTGGVRGISGIPRPFGELPYLASQFAYLALVLAVVVVAWMLVER